MTVEELRKALEGAPDDLEVMISTDVPFATKASEAYITRLFTVDEGISEKDVFLIT